MIHKPGNESTDHYKVKQVFLAGYLMTEEKFLAECEKHSLAVTHCDNSLLGEPNSICASVLEDGLRVEDVDPCVEWVEDPEYELGQIKWSEF